MPEKIKFLPRDNLLSLEELERLCDAFIELGVKKIRITGGEPLVRKNIVQLFKGISNNLGNGLEELTLTTNGSQLEHHAEELFNSGVKRINVSLDTLDKNKFKLITKFDNFDKVMRGIHTAKKIGMKIKINAVALKDINDNEILDLVKWCGENQFTLTFIEVMPMGEMGKRRIDQFVPLLEIKKLLEKNYKIVDDPLKTSGPASYVHCNETDQKIGFITPLTHNFCDSCNRVRITCTGKMYMCLGQEDKEDLIKPLRDSDNNDLLKEVIYKAILRKPKGHDFEIGREKKEKFVPRHMNVTGG